MDPFTGFSHGSSLNPDDFARGDPQRISSGIPDSESSELSPRSRSCVNCRSRKIKCDRQIPCKGCIRSGVPCTYPAGPGRAPKRARRPVDSRVLDRLSRLEVMMKQMGGERGQIEPQQTVPSRSQETKAQAEHGKEKGSGTGSGLGSSSVDQQLGRLVIDDTRSRYVSNKLWANLTSEIEELRDLLHDEPSSDNEEDSKSGFDHSVTDSTLDMGSNAAIMGFQTVAPSMRAYHPTLSQLAAFAEIFKEKVLPLVHIFHFPTLMRDYWEAIASLDNLDRNTEALLFAIYYSNIISMDSEECESVTGVSREVALGHYQFAVQQAIARADLLNTQSVTLIQAVVLFLSALRNVDASRRPWSLTALVFHIARAMGLHRDGTAFGLPPLETELRRRLWWHICFLDIRSSEHHGCQPIVQESAFDTQPPLNINDSDMVHGVKKPLEERVEATEMTFCLIRCEVLRVAWKASYFAPSETSSDQPKTTRTSMDPETMAKELQEKLEERYIKYCDSSIPFFKMCMTVARLMIARIWLAVYYPPKQNSSPDLSAVTTSTTAHRDDMFQTAIKILELSSTLITSPDVSQWTWHSKTHIQWHAVVLVLAEICSRPPSAECDHAWECVDTVYNRWNLQADKARLWMPIKRLMERARYARSTQKGNDTEALSGASTGVPTTTHDLNTETTFLDFVLDSTGFDFAQELLDGAPNDLELIDNNFTMGDWIDDSYDLSFVVN